MSKGQDNYSRGLLRELPNTPPPKGHGPQSSKTLWSVLPSPFRPDLAQLGNIATVATLIVESALQRQESRGLHYVVDYPSTDERFLRDTVLWAGVNPVMTL